MKLRATPKLKETWEDDKEVLTAVEVIIEDDEPEYTGILDAYGNKLYRVRERFPMGFDLGG